MSACSSLGIPSRLNVRLRQGVDFLFVLLAVPVCRLCSFLQAFHFYVEDVQDKNLVITNTACLSLIACSMLAVFVRGLFCFQYRNGPFPF